MEAGMRHAKGGKGCEIQSGEEVMSYSVYATGARLTMSPIESMPPPPEPIAAPPACPAFAGSSYISVPCNISHSSVRLSLPQDSSRPASCGHHDTDSTPLLWPRSSARGVVVLLRRSHTRSRGLMSSSDAVMITKSATAWPAADEAGRPILGANNHRMHGGVVSYCAGRKGHKSTRMCWSQALTVRLETTEADKKIVQ